MNGNPNSPQDDAVPIPATPFRGPGEELRFSRALLLRGETK